MDTYLFKFSACLLVFWLLYILILERQKMHHLKRVYLLGSVALSLLIPILTITYYVEPIVTNFEVSPLFIPIEPEFAYVAEEIQPFWDLEKILWLIYGIGVLLFSTRFIINLAKMYRRISGHIKVSERSFIYVLLQELRIPHSFFNYIFLNQSKYETESIPKEVILHEETHAKQLHSIDILAIELLQIIFWFHPLVYILKHHIKLNHEFLADQAVLQEGVDTKTYQNILLQFSSNTDEYQLSSAINYSSIKKRFTVMKTQTSKTKIWLSSLLLLPIIAILYYSFAEKEYIEKENTDLVEAIKEELKEADKLDMQYLDAASEKLMQEYRDFIKEYTETNTIFGQKYERAIIIYDQLMSPHQRSTVEKYPKRFIPAPNLSKTKPRKPSSTQFEAFKNSKEYAVWIDGKHVSNTVLNNYSANDFVHYSGSIVHKNARSKKFPQPNQYHLYTKAGFKTTYQDSQLNRYKTATKKYSNAISEYLKGPQEDNSELQILFVLAHDIYSTFSEEDIKRNNIKFPPGCPSTKKELSRIKNTPTLTIKKDGTWWINNKKTSIESIKKDFNALVKGKKLPLNLNSENPISVPEINKIQLKIGDNITSVQVNPRYNAIYDTGENVSKYQVENYLKIYKKYEALRTSKPHYINKSEKQQKEMDALFSELGGIYFRMSKSAKAKVERPIAPVRPYAKITLNRKTYYKKYEDLTKEEKATLPPPPPPPTKKSKGGPDAEDYYNPSFLEYIIEMEQLGASFYLDDKKITVKKAKSIANSGERTEMITQKGTDGNYVVKLSSSEKNKNYARSIELKILNDGSYIIDGIKATKRTFSNVFNQLHQDITPEIRNNIMNIHVSSSKEISNKETWFIYNALQDYGFYRIVTSNQVINRAKGNTPFAIKSSNSSQQKLPTKKEISAYSAWAKERHSESKKLSKDATWYPPIDEQKFIKFTDIYNRMSKRQKNQSVEFPFPGLEAKASEQQGATKKQIAEYNKLANHCNSQLKREFPIIKVKDVKKIEYLYSKMSEDQKKNVESYPDFSKLPPPPPPPPEKQERPTVREIAEYDVWAKKMNVAIKKAEATHTKTKEYPIIKKKDYDKYYKIYSTLMTEAQRENAEPWPNIPPPPPPPTKAKQYKNGKKKTLNEIIKETPKGVESGYEVLENRESHYFTVYKGKKTYYNKDGFITDEKGNVLPPPPPAPPAPESTLDFVIRMAKANAKFFYKLKPISSDKAIDILKKEPNTHINAQKTDTKEPLVYMSNKPIHVGVKGKDSKTQEPKAIKNILNGKIIKNGKLSMTRNEFKNIKLATKNGEVIEFKFKIPGKPTQTIKGNSLDEDAIKNLESVKQDDNLVLFGAKDGSDSKIEPLVIKITD